MKRRGFLATLAAAVVAPFAKVKGGEPVQAVRPKLTAAQRRAIWNLHRWHYGLPGATPPTLFVADEADLPDRLFNGQAVVYRIPTGDRGGWRGYRRLCVRLSPSERGDDARSSRI